MKIYELGSVIAAAIVIGVVVTASMGSTAPTAPRIGHDVPVYSEYVDSGN